MAIPLAVTYVLAVLFLQLRQTLREDRAQEMEHETFEALQKWRRVHHYPWRSRKGRRLVRERIVAHEHYLRVCTFVKRDEKHVRFLYSLLGNRAYRRRLHRQYVVQFLYSL